MATATRLKGFGATVVAVAGAYSALSLRDPTVSQNDRGGSFESMRNKIADVNAVVPSRQVQESALMGTSSVNPLDILVVGGGATGSGVALDAVSRGLRVGLVEREDFSSGTSSRSTKLIHGGIPYFWISFLLFYFIILFYG